MACHQWQTRRCNDASSARLARARARTRDDPGPRESRSPGMHAVGRLSSMEASLAVFGGFSVITLALHNLPHVIRMHIAEKTFAF